MNILQKISDYGEILERLKDNDEINEHNYMDLFNNLRDIRDLYKDSRFISLYCIYTNTLVADSDDTICSTVNKKKIITLKVEIDPSAGAVEGIEQALTSNTIPEQSVEVLRDSLIDPDLKFSLTFKTGLSEFYNVYKMIEY
tara:strand:+ start:685 stop:1107 length:423 start_codon:yes stop_codon:yes gene_type:complete